MNKKIIIIVAAAVLVLGSIAVYFLFLAPKKEAVEPKSVYVPGDYFVTNVKDSYSLLKVTIVLEVNKDAKDEEFVDFLTANNHIIRDTIVFILREKTEEELRASDIKQTLGAEIVQKVNGALGIDNIKTVYFNDYVIQ